MAQGHINFAHVARMLADSWTPDSNLEEQLKEVLEAEHKEHPEGEPRVEYIFNSPFQLEGPDRYQLSHEQSCFWPILCNRFDLDQHSCHSSPYNRALFRPCETALRTLSLIASKKRLREDFKVFPFFRLPLEIRHEVYSHCISSTGRTLTWERHLQVQHQYWEYLAPGPSYGVLFASRQLYDEFEPILYRSHVFDFEDSLIAGVGFLKQISQRARLNIRSISMTRYNRLVDVRYFHRYENDSFRASRDEIARNSDRHWNSFCIYVSQHLRLRELRFECGVTSAPADLIDSAWVRDLCQIQGLRKLSQKGIIPQDERHGPPDRSSITLNRLQALLKYLRSKMLAEDAPAPSAHDLVWHFPTKNDDWIAHMTL